MGWTGHYTDRPSEEVIREELSYGGHNTIVANRGARYWVLEREGERFAVVVLVQRRDGMVYTKVMTEDMGPYECAFPLSFLDLLSPTDNEYALNWRERVRKHHATKQAKPKLAKGDTIRLAESPKFSDGRERSVLTYLGGYRFRDEYGQVVRLHKSWRTTYTWSVVTPELSGV